MSIRDKMFIPTGQEGDLLRDFATAAYDAMAKEADQLVVTIENRAAGAGIDPKYLMHLLVKDPGRWKSAVGSGDVPPLKLAIELAVDRADRMTWERFTEPGPDKAASVDRALSKIGKWASRKFVPTMAKAYTAALHEYARKAVDVIKAQYGESMSGPEAFSYMHNTFYDLLEGTPFGIMKRAWLARMLNEFN